MTACERCKGACCESITVPLKSTSEDVQRWLSFHGNETENGIRFECKCSKLKNGKCSIYESRPEVCRTYEVGSRACRETVELKRSFIKQEIFDLMI